MVGSVTLSPRGVRFCGGFVSQVSRSGGVFAGLWIAVVDSPDELMSSGVGVVRWASFAVIVIRLGLSVPGVSWHFGITGTAGSESRLTGAAGVPGCHDGGVLLMPFSVPPDNSELLI
jgi:hypothetical protein